MVPLTHVCRRWRESLISTPENWTLVSSETEDMAAVCLQRAKAAPLEITIRAVYPGEPGFLFHRILEPYIQNTRTLAVTFLSTVEEFTEMFPNFPRSMPKLELLKLAQSNEDDQMEYDDWSIDPFQPFTSTLKSLSLDRIPLYPSLLGIRTLTELSLTYDASALTLDTFLDFLEGNHSLKCADLDITFNDPPPSNPQRQILNQLQYLTVASMQPMHARALATSIPLRRGAHLKISIHSDDIVAMNDIIPNVFTTHLLSPPAPTFFQLENGWYRTKILLRGPGGELSIRKHLGREDPLSDLHPLPLINVREFRLVHPNTTKTNIPVFHPPLLPSLEALTIECNIECEIDVRRVLSILLSNPTSSPLLKTLAFLNCPLPEELIEELTGFASERKKTLTSAWLYRVLIVRQDGKFPSAASISKLKRYVRVVDVWMGNELPEVLP